MSSEEPRRKLTIAELRQLIEKNKHEHDPTNKSIPYPTRILKITLLSPPGYDFKREYLMIKKPGDCFRFPEVPDFANLDLCHLMEESVKTGRLEDKLISLDGLCYDGNSTQFIVDVYSSFVDMSSYIYGKVEFKLDTGDDELILSRGDNVSDSDSDSDSDKDSDSNCDSDCSSDAL